MQTVGEQLPELSGLGLTAFDCGQGVAIGDEFLKPAAPHIANCWEGERGVAFTLTATEIADLTAVQTGGVDVTAQACPADVFNASTGIACRALYVGQEGDDVLVRVIVVLSDPAGAVAKLPADPNGDDVDAVLQGAHIEVLIGTEPVPTA